MGCVVRHDGVAGRIVEVESYHEEEPACHAYAGMTPRTRVLFGAPGLAYVYRSYGIHALLNAVAEEEGIGAAALIRALEPSRASTLMRERRGLERVEDLCNGPGKLTQALGIWLDLNGTPLVGRADRDPPAHGRARDRRRHPDRDQQGRGAAVALLRCGERVRVAAVAARSRPAPA